jgi:hypothetical protein
MLEAGNGTKFQLLSLFNIVGPFFGFNKELVGVSRGIRAPVEFDSLLGSFGWHPRRTVSKHKRPCWKNPSKIE